MLKIIGYSCSVILISGLILAAVSILQPQIDYNRWDNYEYFTPMISYSQNCWLKGEIPYWNPHQLMGEPVVAAGQAGPFYVPYLLSVLLVQTLHLPPGLLCFVIVALHLPFAAMGWFLLLATMDVRRSFCILISLGICFGGYITLVSMVWIFMMPVFAFLPWILLGLVLILKDEKLILGSAVLIIALAAAAYIGHPQMLVYSWLFAVLYAAVFSFVFRKPRLAVLLLFCFFIAMLISLPPVLPVFKAIESSPRSTIFSRSDFMALSLTKDNLCGLLLPLYKIKNCTMGTPSSMWAYQSVWFVPGFLGGVTALLVRRRLKYSHETIRQHGRDRRRKVRQLAPHPPETTSMCNADATVNPLNRMFFFSWFPGLLLLLFALGKDGFLYEWSYGIPVWSAFRWPIKFCCYCFPALAFSAGLGLELWTRFLEKRPVFSKWRFTVGPLLCGLAILLFLLKPASLSDSFAWICLGSALVFLGFVGWIDRQPLRWLLLVLSICNIIAFQGLCHTVDYKRYQQIYGSVGPQQLHIDPAWRMIPISSSDLGNKTMQWLGLSDSATANGYCSYFGIPAGLIPSWFQFPILANLNGGPTSRRAVSQFLNTHLMHSFNIRYISVSPGDTQSLSLLSNMGGVLPLFVNDKVMIYENPDALSRAYFASNLCPFDEVQFLEGMLNNKAPATSAFIENYSGPQTTPTGTVCSLRESSSRVDIRVDAPQGGFLVLAVSYYPDWKVTVEGRPATLCRVNKRVMGVHVPPGAQNVTFTYHSTELAWGCTGALLGMGSFGVWVVIAHGRKLKEKTNATV